LRRGSASEIAAYLKLDTADSAIAGPLGEA